MVGAPIWWASLVGHQFGGARLPNVRALSAMRADVCYRWLDRSQTARRAVWDGMRSQTTCDPDQPQWTEAPLVTKRALGLSRLGAHIGLARASVAHASSAAKDSGLFGSLAPPNLCPPHAPLVICHLSFHGSWPARCRTGHEP